MSYFCGEKLKASTWQEKYFWKLINLKMASAEDKNAAGEAREEADGEVRIIYTYNDMRII